MCCTNHKLKNLEKLSHFQAYHPFHPSANDVYLWFQITLDMLIIVYYICSNPISGNPNLIPFITGLSTLEGDVGL